MFAKPVMALNSRQDEKMKSHHMLQNQIQPTIAHKRIPPGAEDSAARNEDTHATSAKQRDLLQNQQKADIHLA